jgi:hypothetical protein
MSSDESHALFTWRKRIAGARTRRVIVIPAWNVIDSNRAGGENDETKA